VARALSYRADSGLSVVVAMQYQITQQERLFTSSCKEITDLYPIQIDKDVKAP